MRIIAEMASRWSVRVPWRKAFSITSQDLAYLPIDTGLRFRGFSANTFQCTACAAAVTLNEDHGEAE